MSEIQMEKLKRLHEDYFISLVECGINIPKDKLNLFKTLFLKHYKKQIMFEGNHEDGEQEPNTNSSLPVITKTKNGKKFMNPDDFFKIISKTSRMKPEKDQSVVNLIKSCQSNYNFSNNLLREDKDYLEKLSNDISRKLRLHFNLGKKKEMDKNIEIK